MKKITCFSIIKHKISVLKPTKDSLQHRIVSVYSYCIYTQVTTTGSATTDLVGSWIQIQEVKTALQILLKTQCKQKQGPLLSSGTALNTTDWANDKKYSSKELLKGLLDCQNIKDLTFDCHEKQNGKSEHLLSAD